MAWSLRRVRAGCASIIWLSTVCSLAGQERQPTQRAQEPATAIDAHGLPGSRIFAGGGKLPARLYERFLELAGGSKARILLIPTASARADSETGQKQILERWQQAHPTATFEVLHTRDRETADSAEFCKAFEQATGVWIGGGAQAKLAAAYVGTRVEQELQSLLQRGGVVGGSSAGCAIQTRTMIVRGGKGEQPPELGTGLNHLPLAILDQHFLQRKREPRLAMALAQSKGLFGLGIDEGTAVLVRGRSLRVLGSSKAVLMLPAAHGKPAQRQELAEGDEVDLVAWQRRARQRGQGPWPATALGSPTVAHGALVIVGGGRLPAAILERFVALAGGAANARVVLVPTATPARARRGGAQDFGYIGRRLRELGVRDLYSVAAEHPGEVRAEDVQAIDRATAIWFGGGRQWRIVDAFEDTAVEPALHRVLARGGVVGGSSAGATIQGEFLVRGSPRGNREMWCEGYDRGFAFLPGCAIDQHFVARNRLEDLRGVIAQIPQVIGLGIDEGTAAVVTGSTLEVLGNSKIAVLDGRAQAAQDAQEPDQPPPIIAPTWLQPGDRWDLVSGTRTR